MLDFHFYSFPLYPFLLEYWVFVKRMRDYHTRLSVYDNLFSHPFATLHLTHYSMLINRFLWAIISEDTAFNIICLWYMGFKFYLERLPWFVSEKYLREIRELHAIAHVFRDIANLIDHYSLILYLLLSYLYLCIYLCRINDYG